MTDDGIDCGTASECCPLPVCFFGADLPSSQRSSSWALRRRETTKNSVKRCSRSHVVQLELILQHYNARALDPSSSSLPSPRKRTSVRLLFFFFLLLLLPHLSTAMKRLFTKRNKSSSTSTSAETTSARATPPLSTTLPAGVVPYTSPQSPETIEPGLVRPRPTYASPTSSFAPTLPSAVSPTSAPASYPTPPASHQSHSLNQSQSSATSPVDPPVRSSSLLQSNGGAGRTGLPGLSPIRTQSESARSTVSDVSGGENEGKLSVG